MDCFHASQIGFVMFFTNGSRDNNVKIRPVAERPFWKFGEKDKAFPIDQLPVITTSHTLKNTILIIFVSGDCMEIT